MTNFTFSVLVAWTSLPRIKMDSTLWTLGVLLLFRFTAGYGAKSTSEIQKGTSKRLTRSTDNVDNDRRRCGYTFLVPQQKITGPICVSTKSSGPNKDQVTRMDLENVKDSLAKQRREMEMLQVLVDVDGNIVSEVKLLRKESRNMNSRVTQLYMQLLHEIIRKRDNSLEIAQLENKILNVTAEMLKAATRYKELELKYASLIDLVNNQSAVITLLEDQCMSVFSRRDNPGSPPLVQVVPQHIPNTQQYTLGLSGGNEIQRDTGYPRARDSRQPPQAPVPTESPFRVPPVTVINEGNVHGYIQSTLLIYQH